MPWGLKVSHLLIANMILLVNICKIFSSGELFTISIVSPRALAKGTLWNNVEREKIWLALKCGVFGDRLVSKKPCGCEVGRLISCPHGLWCWQVPTCEGDWFRKAVGRSLWGDGGRGLRVWRPNQWVNLFSLFAVVACCRGLHTLILVLCVCL